MYSEDEYDSKQSEITDRYKEYLKALKKNLKEELISRINEIVIFSKLTREALVDIAENQLNKTLAEYKAEYNISITYSVEIIDFLLKKSGQTPRKISSVIDKFIKSAITRAYIKKQIQNGEEFKLILLDNRIAIQVD